MSKIEQTGGGGGGTEMTPRKERKPSSKRPWRKPRVRLVDFAATKSAGTEPGRRVKFEASDPTDTAYDPNIS